MVVMPCTEHTLDEKQEETSEVLKSRKCLLNQIAAFRLVETQQILFLNFMVN